MEMESPGCRLLLLCLLMTAPQLVPAAGQSAPAGEPELISIFPIGAQQASRAGAEIRGRLLDGVYAVWSASPALRAEVGAVRAAEAEPAAGKKKDTKKPKPPVQILSLRFDIAEDADVGNHEIRLIGPGGISAPLTFRVHAEPVVAESDGVHDLPTEAHKIPNRPIVINGTIAEQGEVDYYSFEAGKDEEIRFEVFSAAALDPAITLYQITGSWFSKDRASRLAFIDEPVPYPGLTNDTELTYRFSEKGTYLVRVSGFLGAGGPDHGYQLHAGKPVNDASSRPARQAKRPEWKERTWTRKLDPARMMELWSRAVLSLAPSASEIEEAMSDPKAGALATTAEVPVVDLDAEPAGLPVGPREITLPSLLVGAIEHPGDIDRVKFDVKAGDHLVLEVETPEKTLPLLNPYLRVVDAEGVEAFTNILSRVNANGVISKQIHPKTAYAFPRDGSFTLEIRDITYNYGDSEMKYRVMVRPRVPHVGEVVVADDHLNLLAGEAAKLTVVTSQEEGYEGLITLAVEGLPEGVEAFAGTEVEPDRPPSNSTGKIERFQTKTTTATFVLAVDADAPATRLPVRVRVMARPVMRGRAGEAIQVKELLVMVVRPEKLLTGHASKSPSQVR